jgi:DNA excision repair protein ERCC-2
MKYKISVRALCEFSARRGDLDLRFTPAPSALEGMEGHAIVRARRPAGYEKEISLSDSISLPGGCAMQVSGRADGYDPALNRLEEIKTFRGRVEAIPDNHRALHWAQAKTYAHLLCVARGLEKIQVALVYYDVDRRTETVLTEEHNAASLAESYQAHCACFAAWARQETAHRAWRDEALESLRFPFDAMHAGQRTLAQVPASAGPGAHRHRQNAGHPLSHAQGRCARAAGQNLFPHGQDAGARHGPACACTAGSDAERGSGRAWKRTP